jgi:hypothetical protein
MDFSSIFLGQSVLKYKVPLEIFVGLNGALRTLQKNFT